MNEPVPESKILASHFATCFSTDAGKKVLKYLQEKFKGLRQPVFVEIDGQPYDPLRAAVRDGRRQVVDLIELQIENHKNRDQKPTQTKSKR